VSFDDNGIGIDPAHFKRIFEIFGRVYGDKKFEGTGIGLAIAIKTAERMGGEIGVESQLDHGNRFWFTLNRAE
jgi:signal transduction histidine kinase